MDENRFYRVVFEGGDMLITASSKWEAAYKFMSSYPQRIIEVHLY